MNTVHLAFTVLHCDTHTLFLSFLSVLAVLIQKRGCLVKRKRHELLDSKSFKVMMDITESPVKLAISHKGVLTPLW